MTSGDDDEEVIEAAVRRLLEDDRVRSFLDEEGEAGGERLLRLYRRQETIKTLLDIDPQALLELSRVEGERRERRVALLKFIITHGDGTSWDVGPLTPAEQEELDAILAGESPGDILEG